MKHRFKVLLREVWARALWHTGAYRLIDRWSARRLLVLYGHCVEAPEINGTLSAEMKISAARLEEFLRVLGRRFELVTVGEGWAAIEAGRGRSLVALSMDDGYRDNLLELVPLLERTGARATVFLEAGPVLGRQLGWLHRFEAAVRELGAPGFASRYAALCEQPAIASALVAAGKGSEATDRIKRILKYDADPADRDRTVARVLDEAGGDARSICNQLYMTSDEARAMLASHRVEVGGHTRNHPVLATLAPDDQAAEIGGGRADLETALGEATGRTFAYPYGRRWDFDAASAEAAREAGYACAVTTHAGVNRAGTDPFHLRRWPIHDGTPLHLLAVEAAGGFELLRKFGLDLVE